MKTYTGTYLDGIVLSNPATDDLATITATGYVTNNTATHNYDAIYGAPGYAWTVVNLGTIRGGAPIGAYNDPPPSEGIHLMAGGVVINGQSGSGVGSIEGQFAGVDIEGGIGSVTNYGTIASGGSDFTDGVLLQEGGSVTNEQSGLIVGGTGVSVASIGTVVNFGNISGVADGGIISGYAIGVFLFQGKVTNNFSGLITGYDTGVLINHGSIDNLGTIQGWTGVNFSGTLPGTVTNAGTIIGDGGTAVQFGGGDDQLIVKPGAVFVGAIDGAGGSDVLELAAGTGNKTLSGLGTSFTNFETVVFDANAGWIVTLDNPAAFTGTISGFAAGDILDLTGRAATGVTYAGGVLTVKNGGAVVTALHLTGSYTTADFSLSSDGHGGTNIGVGGQSAGIPSSPVITSPASFSIAENGTAVGTITATDAYNDNLSFAVSGGVDAGFFTIDDVTGALSFVTARDFETPEDAGANNGYNISVSVSDGSHKTTQDVVVAVTDVSEAGIIKNGTNASETITGGFGNDTLKGLSGNDVISGGDGSDIVSGGNGNDQINGGRGADRLSGDAGNDSLNGGPGNDTLIGGAGKDQLVGGTGDDVMTGGPDGDTFAFYAGFGHDVVADKAKGDLVEFHGGLFDNFADMLASSAQVGADVLISVDAFQSVLLENLALTNLKQADFHFSAV